MMPISAAAAATVEFVWGMAYAVSISGEKRELQKGMGIDVGDNRFQGDQVAVDIRYDRQPLRHGRCTEPSSANFQSGLWATSQT